MSRTNIGRAQGKDAFVTGATGGIGRATCSLFARAGASVVGFDPTAHEEDSSLPDLDITGLQGVVSVEDAVRDAVGEVAARAERLEVLVKYAGVTGPSGPAHALKQPGFGKLLAVNVRSTWLFTKHVVSRMLESRGGSIVNIFSMNGIVGGSSITLYHATNAATRLMATSNSVACASQRIRTNSIHPRLIATPMTEDRGSRTGSASADHYQGLVESLQLARWGDPEDVANGVRWPVSDESPCVTWRRTRHRRWFHRQVTTAGTAVCRSPHHRTRRRE